MFDEHNFRLRMECHKLLMLLSNVHHCKYMVHNQISVRVLQTKMRDCVNSKDEDCTYWSVLRDEENYLKEDLEGDIPYIEGNFLDL